MSAITFDSVDRTFTINTAEIEQVVMQPDDPAQRPGKFVVEIRYRSGALLICAGQDVTSAKAHFAQIRQAMERSR